MAGKRSGVALWLCGVYQRSWSTLNLVNAGMGDRFGIVTGPQTRSTQPEEMFKRLKRLKTKERHFLYFGA